MRQREVQAKIGRAAGIVADHLGDVCELYRARGGARPVGDACRVGSKLIYFAVATSQPADLARFGGGAWLATLDGSDVSVGDYFVGPVGVFFVVACEPLKPVLCVKTTRTVSIFRTMGSMAAGVGSYSGVQRSSMMPLLIEWPVSVLTQAPGATDYAGLPNAGTSSRTTILLPRLANDLPTPRPGDLAYDDQGFAYSVESSEQSDFGCRLSMRLTVA